MVTPPQRPLGVRLELGTFSPRQRRRRFVGFPLKCQPKVQGLVVVFFFPWRGCFRVFGSSSSLESYVDTYRRWLHFDVCFVLPRKKKEHNTLSVRSFMQISIWKLNMEECASAFASGTWGLGKNRHRLDKTKANKTHNYKPHWGMVPGSGIWGQNLCFWVLEFFFTLVQ